MEYYEKLDEYRYPNQLDQATMTHDEWVAFQGKNGEIYKGMVEKDPEIYRLESTGTSKADIANEVNKLMTRDMTLTPNQNFVTSKIPLLMANPDTISKLMEFRMKKTTDFLYEYADFNPEHIYTDLSIISHLMSEGYTFDDFLIDLSLYSGEDPRMADINELLEYYKEGLMKKKSTGKVAIIPNPKSSSEMINAEDFIEYLQKMQLSNVGKKTEEDYERLKNKLDSMSSLNDSMVFDKSQDGVQR